MGTNVKNLDGAEAQRRLAAQLAPSDEGASGPRGVDQNYEADTAELQRLQDEMQIGHDRPTSK